MTSPLRPSVAITEPDRPQIWVGCFRCRNDGLLVGDWFDAVGAETITVAEVHRGSGVDWAEEGCEEIWVFDTDGVWPTSTEMDTTTAGRWGELYELVGPNQWPAFCAWARSEGVTIDGEDLPDVGTFEERYEGEHDDWNAFVWHHVVEMDLQAGWPDEAVRYFDVTRYGRDLRHSYSVEDAQYGGVYVFRDA
ncbi:antirestriction protein ArdA [Gordonia neofelifaecis]|uniref:Antirestriction ArdA family protein n=1 Tax=Gordonia neofelifaecis NRRL B-59395 TaxID=644548 RepID=F1YE61_9ACTN|nr:antirestriction protein ArdA [Gordonia neofelifaecis]EGD57151.1 antirestriction ArdA family protein [Gordonia neofelifaecis NRRL B-59395]